MKRNSNAGTSPRFTQIAAALITATALVACGGGSGNTVVDKPGVTLFTSAPTNVTIPSGETASFNVGGGGGGSQFVSYKVTSSDTSIASAVLNGTKITITALQSGNSTIKVTDNAGANVSFSVNVPSSSPVALSVSAPTNVTLTPGATSQYNIVGGTGPYTAVASNSNVAAVAAGANVVSVTAANPGSSAVVIYDAKGVGVKFDVTVAGATGSNELYTTAPDTLYMSLGTTGTYQIAGGTPPYTATSNFADLLDASATGSVLTLHSKNQPGRATVNIRDSQGIVIAVVANVSGSAAAPLYTTAPSSVDIPVGPAPVYTVRGGTGPYTASSSKPGVAKATIEGNDLSIIGVTSGMADIVVFDATGAITKISTTVGGGAGSVPLYTTSPDSITVAHGASPTYTIAGGAGPYAVTSSDVATVTVTSSGNTFTATGVAAGLAIISIRDANGTVIKVNVTVK